MDLERIGKAARRLLQELDARVANGKTSSEHSQKGSDELKKPERSESAQRPGKSVWEDGLEKGGPRDGVRFDADDARGPDPESLADADRAKIFTLREFRNFKRGEGAGKGFAARAAGIVVPFPAARQAMGVEW